MRTKSRRRPADIGLTLVSMTGLVAALVGLFLPFVQQSYGCPPNRGCLLFAGVAQPTLIQGQTGLVLLGLTLAAFIVALLSLVRPGWPLSLIGAALVLATLALICLDAATARNWVWQSGDPFPVTFEAGFYLTAIGSAEAAVIASLLVAGGGSWPWKDWLGLLASRLTWVYPVAMAMALAGLFLPFVKQGCPGTVCISIKLALPYGALFQGRDGAILLALVAAALLVGFVAAARLSAPLLLVQLALPLAILALIGFDASNPSVQVLQHPLGPFSSLLVFASGFYLAVVGSAFAVLLAVLLLGSHVLRGPTARPWSLGKSAA